MELEDQQPEAQQPAAVAADAGSDDLLMLSGITTAELFRKPISSWSRLDMQIDVDLSSDGENSDTGGLSYQVLAGRVGVGPLQVQSPLALGGRSAAKGRRAVSPPQPGRVLSPQGHMRV